MQRLFETVEAFVGEELQEDDQTMVVIRVVGDEEIKKLRVRGSGISAKSQLPNHSLLMCL